MADYLRSIKIICLVALAAATFHTFAANHTCQAIEKKLSSLEQGECSSFDWQGGTLSVGGNQLQYIDLNATSSHEDTSRILVIGGIHGDEFSSVTISFKWLSVVAQQLHREFDWRFIPASNPDGLLSNPGRRQNGNGIDLNRNFPTADWKKKSSQYFHKVGRDPRRFPGDAAASEIETRWLMEQIETFNPDVIIAIHAPYHLLDFDGPPLKPLKMGQLALNQLGIYPGSLGNYGSLCLGKQVVTLELPSAGIMPKEAEIKRMWRDLVRWLANNAEYHRNNKHIKAQARRTACAYSIN